MSKLLFFGLLGSTPGKRRPRHDPQRQRCETRCSVEHFVPATRIVWRRLDLRHGMPLAPLFLRHSIHRCMGCCAAWPMLCAGLREWVSAASLAGPFCSTSRAAPTSYSLFVPGREIHVATDDPMMASMAGRYAAALFELAKDQRQLAEVERDLASFQKMLDDSPDLRRLVRSPVISADDQAKALAAILAKARHLRAHGKLSQADRQEPAPVCCRRHAEELPRAHRS